jgi:hypothetical protein
MWSRRPRNQVGAPLRGDAGASCCALGPSARPMCIVLLSSNSSLLLLLLLQCVETAAAPLPSCGPLSTAMPYFLLVGESSDAVSAVASIGRGHDGMVRPRVKSDDVTAASQNNASIFDVVWNSDFSVHCQRINQTLRLTENGISANKGQAWFGAKIGTLYAAGESMPSVLPNGSVVNGGIPQLADRSQIKRATAALLRSTLPPTFAGLGIFDIEYPSLYPLWGYDFGPADQTVRRLATNWTATHYPGLSGARLVNQTISDFNRGMEELWKLQLQTASAQMPRARFGYYRMPHCWYSNSQPFAPCNGQGKFGDQLAWLWQSEGGVFPGAYFASGNDANASARLVSVVREAVRVAQVHGFGRPSVMPFVSYAYRGGVRDHQMLPPHMLWNMLAVPASLGVDGVVIWGGTGDADTVDCEALSQALDVVGPQLAQLRRDLARCASQRCSGHGRCASWYTPTLCVCIEGWAGDSCDERRQAVASISRGHNMVRPRMKSDDVAPVATGRTFLLLDSRNIIETRGPAQLVLGAVQKEPANPVRPC